MKTETRKFKKTIKTRARKARKDRSGQSNHAMGNVISHMQKTGQLKMKGNSIITKKK